MSEPIVWGPVSWLIEPIDLESDWYKAAMEKRTYDLGFSDFSELAEAEHVSNRASDGDEMAAVAMPYIEWKRTRVMQARKAAGGKRRGKWDHVRGDALEIAKQVRAARPDLKASSVAGVVMDRLADEHAEIPARTTIMGWMKDFDG
ncbi:hypothetical protein [Shimia sagamensis]|uniref:Uncharacterized protein n=1 Tax=Shimia sagamensis TaxID=1566352 RepID=A0ABY1PIU5_9RHOB|nr:hypothetical protein [Shimia sagamensis]SMP35302.1 hypothetical protein SAMN06265373_11162 [Shimia sagamensis]